MIKHPDGRIEGTAAEIAEYERMKAEREKVEKGPFGPSPLIPLLKIANKCPYTGKQCFCTVECALYPVTE